MGEAPPGGDGADGVTPAGICGEQRTVRVIKTDPAQVLPRGGAAVLAQGSLQTLGDPIRATSAIWTSRATMPGHQWRHRRYTTELQVSRVDTTGTGSPPPAGDKTMTDRFTA
jgi:hypothetical protein